MGFQPNLGQHSRPLLDHDNDKESLVEENVGNTKQDNESGLNQRIEKNSPEQATAWDSGVNLAPKQRKLFVRMQKSDRQKQFWSKSFARKITQDVMAGSFSFSKMNLRITLKLMFWNIRRLKRKSPDARIEARVIKNNLKNFED